MLAWSRHQLGWLAADQLACVTEPDVVLTIGPVSQSGTGVRLAAVPVGPSRVVAVEVRRDIDSDAQTRFANRGVLVYSIDVAQHDRPIRIGNDDGSQVIDRLPLLSVGDQLTVWGHRIEVLAEHGDSYQVRIRKHTQNDYEDQEAEEPEPPDPEPTPDPTPSVRLSKGRSAQGVDSGCTSANCHFMWVELIGFHPGTYTVHCAHRGVPSAGYPPGRFHQYPTSNTVSEICIWGFTDPVYVFVDNPRTGQRVFSDDAQWP